MMIDAMRALEQTLCIAHSVLQGATDTTSTLLLLITKQLTLKTHAIPFPTHFGGFRGVIAVIFILSVLG